MSKKVLMLPNFGQLYTLLIAYSLTVAPCTIPSHAETTAKAGTKIKTASANQQEPTAESDSQSVTMSKKDTTYVAKKSGQEFHLPDCPHATFIVQAGSKLKAYSKLERTIIMPTGKFVVITGKKEEPIDVMTDFGRVNIPSTANAIIEYTPDGITRVQNLSGNSLTITSQVAHHPFAVTIDSGYEVCVATNENANGKQLVANDGVERQVAEVANIPGCKIAMNKIDSRTMCSKEPLLNAPNVTADTKAQVKLLKKKAKPIVRSTS